MRQPSHSVLRNLSFGAALCLLLAALSVAVTWPLPQYADDHIPYTCTAEAPRVDVTTPGDHLQFFYWCWLLKDNLIGQSHPFSQPYEFSTFLPHLDRNYALFPFSLLYVAFSPLGPAMSYNMLFWLSYFLAGLCGYLLAKEVLGSRAVGVFVALTFMLVHTRAKFAYGGHLYGFVAFMLPLILWLVERAIRRRSWRWGAGAACCLVAVAMMEPHLIYFISLFLAVYLPARLILERMVDAPQGSQPFSWASTAILLGTGLSLAAFWHLRAAEDGLAAGWIDYLQTATLHLILLISVWLLLTWLVRSLTLPGGMPPRLAAALALSPLALTPLELILLPPHMPSRYGLVWLSFLALLGMVWLVVHLWRRRGPLPERPLWAPALAVIIGLGLATLYVLVVFKQGALSGSQAGHGRSLAEVAQFSHDMAELFDFTSHGLITTWFGRVTVLLAMGGLALVTVGRPARARGAGVVALWLLLGTLFGLLSLGPRLHTFPFYRLLYDHLMFFNFFRTPAKLAILGIVPLTLAGGWFLMRLAEATPRPRLAISLLCLLAGGLAIHDFWPACHIGLSKLAISPTVSQAIKSNMDAGPYSGQRLLCLPLFAGSQHTSSVYELLITRTRAQTVNGYSPLVTQEYVEQVYQPLRTLNQGSFTAENQQCLERLNVKVIAVYDDADLFDVYESYYPNSFTRRRLEATGRLKLVGQDDGWFVYRYLPEEPPTSNLWVTSPLVLALEAEKLGRQTGRLANDPDASGPGDKVNIVAALRGEDKPHELTTGPAQTMPPGRYLARWRMRRGPGGMPGRIEVVTHPSDKILASRQLTADVLPADGLWHDVPLEFDLPQPEGALFKTHYNGAADLCVDVVLVGFADRARLESFYSASDMWQLSGTLARDGRTPSGLALLARANRDGVDRRFPLCYGPDQTVTPGRYRLGFRLALEKDYPPGAKVVELEATLNQGGLPTAKRVVTAGELLPAGQYHDAVLDFTVPQLGELDLRVHFLGTCDVRLDGVGVQRLAD